MIDAIADLIATDNLAAVCGSVRSDQDLEDDQ